MKEVSVPEWLYIGDKDGLVTAKEFAKICGLSSSSSLLSIIGKGMGSYPPPDKKVYHTYRFRCYWYKSTIIKFLEEQGK